MRKILGYIITWSLLLVGFVIVSPVLVGLLLVVLAFKVRCWALKKHNFDFKLLLAGVPIQNLRCTKCQKLISPEEHSGVLTEAENYIKMMHQTKAYLDQVLKTPDEKAVDDLIDESRTSSQED